MKKLLTIIFFLVSPAIWADSMQENLLHASAHAGSTYAITHTTEVVCRKFISGKMTCTLTGIVLANLTNVAYKGAQGFPSDTKRAVVSGAAGSGMAAIMIGFDF